MNIAEMNDNEIDDVINNIGYSITGRNLFYKKAQEIYHLEVISWEKLNELPLNEKPQAQKDFTNWTNKNKRRILSALINY